MTYYERENILHLDGTHIFQTSQDRKNEQEVAAILEQAWSCQLRLFGSLSPIDWFAVRHERMVGLLDLKSRNHSASHFPTVFLNVRKWLALLLAENGLGVPAIFVVKFLDTVLWIPLRDIDTTRLRIGGCSRRVKSDNDIEPVIEVDVTVMRPL